MTIEIENGVVTKVSKTRKARKAAAAEPAPAKAKKAKAEQPAPAAETPAKRGKLKLVKGTPAPESETPAPAPPAVSKRKPRAVDAEAASAAEHAQSLAGLADAYAGKMLADGKTEGTIASYKAELALACKHIDGETPIAELTVDQVRAFFESKPVTKLRSGRSKSQLSIDKSRRVLRLALVWAAEQGLVKTAPLPELPSAS